MFEAFFEGTIEPEVFSRIFNRLTDNNDMFCYLVDTDPDSLNDMFSYYENGINM
jgi:hypothetical protein